MVVVPVDGMLAIYGRNCISQVLQNVLGFLLRTLKKTCVTFNFIQCMQLKIT